MLEPHVVFGISLVGGCIFVAGFWVGRQSVVNPSDHDLFQKLVRMRSRRLVEALARAELVDDLKRDVEKAVADHTATVKAMIAQ